MRPPSSRCARSTTAPTSTSEAAKQRRASEVDGSPFHDLQPWPDEIYAADFLDTVRETINRFCIVPQHSDILIATWMIHAHGHEYSDISPTLCLTSSEKRCSKSATASEVAARRVQETHARAETGAV